MINTYANIVANDNSLMVNLETRDEINFQNERNALEALLVYALNCDKDFENWETVDYCPRVGGEGVVVLGGSILGYRRKIFESKKSKIMVYAPIRELPRKVEIGFAETLLKVILFVAYTLEDLESESDSDSNADTDSDSGSDASVGSGSELNLRALWVFKCACCGDRIGYRIVKSTHEAWEFDTFYYPLSYTELATDVGKAIYAENEPYRNAVNLVQKGYMSEYVHANNHLWLNAHEIEFTPSLHQLSRMSADSCYPDPHSPNYAILMEQSRNFAEYLTNRYKLKGPVFEVPIVKQNTLNYSIRYGPLIIELSRFGFVSPSVYNEMSLYIPNTRSPHWLGSPWTYEKYVETVGLHDIVENSRLRAQGIATGIALKCSGDAEIRNRLKFADLYPRHSELRKCCEFEVYESLKGPYASFENLNMRLKMRCYVNSLADVDSELKCRGPWWCHEREEPAVLVHNFKINVDEIVSRCGFALLSTAANGIVNTRVDNLLMHLQFDPTGFDTNEAGTFNDPTDDAITFNDTAFKAIIAELRNRY